MGRWHTPCSTQRAATYNKIDYGSRRNRARRHRATLVDEAATRARSSDRAAVERSTASRREVPRPMQEELQRPRHKPGGEVRADS